MAKNGNVTIKRKLQKGKLLQKLVTENEEGMKRVLIGGANAIKEDARLSMALSPPIGVRYGDHVASAPGNPPRIDSGDLEKAVRVMKDPVMVGVPKSSGQGQKAVWMEFGTSDIEPRPFMKPAWERGIPKLRNNVLKFLIRKAKEAGL